MCLTNYDFDFGPAFSQNTEKFPLFVLSFQDRNESLGDSTHYDIVLLDLVMTRKVVVFKSHCRAKLLERGFMRVYSVRLFIISTSFP